MLREAGKQERVGEGTGIRKVKGCDGGHVQGSEAGWDRWRGYCKQLINDRTDGIVSNCDIRGKGSGQESFTGTA